MRTLPRMLYPVNMLHGKRGVAIGLCKCDVRCLTRCFIPCGTTTMSSYMVRSAPSLTHIRLSMNNFVCSTLIFYPIATAIVCLPSLQHVFDHTSYRDGGEREALLQHSSCIMYYGLFCAVTIYVRCMVRTPTTLFPYCSTAQ